MDTSKQIFEQQNRVSKMSEVSIRFRVLGMDQSEFQVIKKDGTFHEEYVSYNGVIHRDRSIHDKCTCMDFLKRSNDNYLAEHGYSLQCKHILAARKARGWN